jgi:hypothetical protein
VKDSDSPFDVAGELIDSSGWIPNREEAREWVAYNCDHWGIARRAEILFA